METLAWPSVAKESNHRSITCVIIVFSYLRRISHSVWKYLTKQDEQERKQGARSSCEGAMNQGILKRYLKPGHVDNRRGVLKDLVQRLHIEFRILSLVHAYFGVLFACPPTIIWRWFCFGSIIISHKNRISSMIIICSILRCKPRILTLLGKNTIFSVQQATINDIGYTGIMDTTEYFLRECKGTSPRLVPRRDQQRRQSVNSIASAIPYVWYEPPCC